ncbi:PDZ domain-containing protein [Acidovorax sp.]|uniref:PDZ domain-containing protein n=1 Tax=Acidovorax sp. TaxID=1872122 RepID=UPI003CFD2D40
MAICKRRWRRLFHAVRQKWAGMLVASVCLAAGVAAAGQTGHQGPRLDSITYVVSNPQIVFAAGDGIFKSTDGGASWVGLKTPLGYGQVVSDPHDPRRVVAVWSGQSSGAGDYLESLDGGGTWSHKHVLQKTRDVAGPFSHQLLMHPSRPGVWLVYGMGKLWTTQNAGASWEAGPDLGLARSRVNLAATQEAFYVHSSTQVWRSEDGKDWQSTGFPDGQELWAMEALSGDRVAVASRQGWWLRSAEGIWRPGPPSPTGESRSQLPWEQGPHPDAMGRHCRPVQSPADAAYLVASCAIGGFSSVPSSIQLHSFDFGATWSRIGGAGLPSSWSPSVIAPHPRDSRILLMAWASGRVFRSHDHGATWAASDGGVSIPRSVEYMDHGSIAVFPLLEYPRETRINQAVIADDLAAVRQLAAAGADLNERGPAGLSAMEWALMLGAHVDRPRREDTMYWALRGLGAAVPSQEHANAKIVWRAVEHGQFGRVLEELLRSGWRLTAKLGEEQDTLLGDQAQHRCRNVWEGTGPKPCSSMLAGRPLEAWIDLHLSREPPGESAQLVLDLAALGQMPLAQRVASVDAGRYRAGSDVVRLMQELPTQASSLRRQILVAYRGRYGDVGVGGALYRGLKDEYRTGDWVPDVLRHDRSIMDPKNAEILVHALLGSLNRPDWVRAIWADKAGPRLTGEGRQAVLASVVLSCDGALVAAAAKAGLPLARTRFDTGESPMRAALGKCTEWDPAWLDPHLDQLHRAGLRLRAYELWDLSPDEAAALRRFPGRADYRGLGACVVARPEEPVAQQAAAPGAAWAPLGLSLPDGPRRSDASVRCLPVGSGAGVGLQLAPQPPSGHAVVQEVIAGYPADLSGIRPGDRIAAVDGISTQGMPVRQVLLRLKGQAGSKVALAVIRGDGRRTTHRVFRQTLPDKPPMATAEK